MARLRRPAGDLEARPATPPAPVEAEVEEETPTLLTLPGDYPEWRRLLPHRADLERLFELHNYRAAVELLSTRYRAAFNELCDALCRFRIQRAWIEQGGGNESEIPKEWSRMLRPLGWEEATITGQLQFKITTRRSIVEQHRGRPRTRREVNVVEQTLPDYISGHKVDYVKKGVAFDLEWNSKDQTFDRDLYAFSRFYECRVIGVGVLLTRSADLNPLFRQMGAEISKKYGASTTWMGKLLYRLSAGRSGGCPVFAIGMKRGCVE